MAFVAALGLFAPVFAPKGDGLGAGGGVMAAANQSGAPQRQFSGRPRVIDGDTLALGEVRIRLHGIDAPERAQDCTDMAGTPWGCGEWSTAVLSRLAGTRVTCTERDVDRYGRSVARCEGASGDIGRGMVAAGAAFAYARYSTDYLGEEAQARRRGVGLWRAAAQTPAEFRAGGVKWAQAAPQGCAIKGNISKSGKIYHLPGSKWYDKTKIDTAKGERWFCSEAEARAAGWRAPRG